LQPCELSMICCVTQQMIVSEATFLLRAQTPRELE
jgi:hypothetical protein